MQLAIFYGYVIFFGNSSQMCLIKVDFSLLLFPFGWHLLDFMTLGDVQNITWTWKRSTQQHATINVSLESQCQILPCKVLIRISHSQIKSLRTNNTLLDVRDCHIGNFTFRVPIKYYFEEYIGLRTKFAPNKYLIVQKMPSIYTVSTASTAYTIALQYYSTTYTSHTAYTVYTAFTAKELLFLYLEYGYNFLLVYIPHICPYWYTTTLFRPVKLHQKVRKFATK